jgi:hypothetical protein
MFGNPTGTGESLRKRAIGRLDQNVYCMAHHHRFGGLPMYFSKEAIADLEKGRSEIAGKYQKLVESYMTIPLRHARAREFATQGLPRRLKIMQLCIENVFIYLKTR